LGDAGRVLGLLAHYALLLPLYTMGELLVRLLGLALWFLVGLTATFAGRLLGLLVWLALFLFFLKGGSLAPAAWASAHLPAELHPLVEGICNSAEALRLRLGLPEFAPGPALRSALRRIGEALGVVPTATV